MAKTSILLQKFSAVAIEERENASAQRNASTVRIPRRVNLVKHDQPRKSRHQSTKTRREERRLPFTDNWDGGSCYGCIKTPERATTPGREFPWPDIARESSKQKPSVRVSIPLSTLRSQADPLNVPTKKPRSSHQPQLPAAEPDPQGKQGNSPLVVGREPVELAETDSVDGKPAASKKPVNRSRKRGKMCVRIKKRRRRARSRVRRRLEETRGTKETAEIRV